MELKCTNPECLHEWNYKGFMIWATCPSCRLKVKNPKIKRELIPVKEQGKASDDSEGVV